MDEHTEACLRAMLAKKQMQVLRFRFDDWIDATPQMVFDRLGVQGHDGAVAEIESLRAGCGRMQGV